MQNPKRYKKHNVINLSRRLRQERCFYSDTLSFCGKRSGTKALKYSA